MQLVTVGTRYQIVIPKRVRERVKGLKPGRKVSVRALDDGTVTVKTDSKSWVKRMGGIAKDAWKNINTTKYLEDLRNEWNIKD